MTHESGQTYIFLFFLFPRDAGRRRSGKRAICLFHGSSYVRTHKVLAIALIFCWVKQNRNHTAVYAGRLEEKCELALKQNNQYELLFTGLGWIYAVGR